MKVYCTVFDTWTQYRGTLSQITYTNWYSDTYTSQLLRVEALLFDAVGVDAVPLNHAGTLVNARL